MSYNKVATNVMTRKGQSSRWMDRDYVKLCSKKKRRIEDKKACSRSSVG